MCNDVVAQVGLMVSYRSHYEFAGFFELAMGCTKMVLKIDPVMLNWIHPVPDFNCVLGFPRPVNNCVGDVGCMDMVVRGSSPFAVFYKIFDLVEDCVNRGLWVNCIDLVFCSKSIIWLGDISPYVTIKYWMSMKRFRVNWPVVMFPMDMMYFASTVNIS